MENRIKKYFCQGSFLENCSNLPASMKKKLFNTFKHNLKTEYLGNLAGASVVRIIIGIHLYSLAIYLFIYSLIHFFSFPYEAFCFNFIYSIYHFLYHLPSFTFHLPLPSLVIYFILFIMHSFPCLITSLLPPSAGYFFITYIVFVYLLHLN